MSHSIIQIITAKSFKDEVSQKSEKCSFETSWKTNHADGLISNFYKVKSNESQALIDAMSPLLNKAEENKILILPVEAAIYKAKEIDEEEPKKKQKDRISREELNSKIMLGANLDVNYLLLILFSTIVTAVGLLENNVAVVVGGMVIAPLLSPNIALSFSVVMGERDLFIKSLKTLISGAFIAFIISLGLGFFWQDPLNSTELLSRTDVRISSMLLALASGASGVLALTSGVSSVLVGVMVAVALLPPTVTAGVFYGAGDFDLGSKAGLLLLVNVVCLNFAALLVFLYKGVMPRTWQQKKKANRLKWTVSLILILVIIFITIFLSLNA